MITLTPLSPILHLGGYTHRYTPGVLVDLTQSLQLHYLGKSMFYYYTRVYFHDELLKLIHHSSDIDDLIASLYDPLH